MIMTRKEVDRLFETDSEGKFIRLVIPPLYGSPELNLIGKTRLELSIDEVVSVKKYAGKLYTAAQSGEE